MSEHSADGDHKHRRRILAIAAAAIVVVGVGAIAFAVSNTNADDPDGVVQAPVPTAAPTTAAPTTSVAPMTESVAGTDLTVTYTLPDGWEADDSPDHILLIGESSVVHFWPDVDNIYTDGCEHTLLDPPLGPTVDDLAAVWATLPGFNVTTPVDITVDGYAGKRVDYTVPDYNEADCVDRKFGLWTIPSDPNPPSFWAQVPMQQNRQWIIDVDGTRLVINEWSEPGTTPEQLADMDQLLATIQIG